MHKILLFVLFISISFQSKAQSVEQQADSLNKLIEKATTDTAKVKRLLDLANVYHYNNPSKTVNIAHQALFISKKNKYQEDIFDAYLTLFNGHYFLGTHSDSLLKYAKLLEEFALLEKDNDALMTSVHWNYAMYYGVIRQSDKEIEAYIKALELTRKSSKKNKKNEEAKLLNNIGSVLDASEKYQEALEYYNEGLALVEDNISKANMLYNVATIYSEEFKNIDTAQILMEQAYGLYKKDNSYDGMADVLIQKATYRDKKGEFERANQMYNEAFEIISKNGLGYLFFTLYVALADHHLLNKQYNLAIENGEKALLEAEKQGNYAYLDEVYTTLDKSYTATGNYKKAHEIRGQLMAYKDSVSNAELKTKVEVLQTQYEVEQKETENQLLKAESAANQKTIQTRGVAAIALLLGLLLLGSWAIVVYRNGRQKQKYNEELEETVADRTDELQKANKDLEQANYELKTFNYIASHDIKEPIRNIGTYAGLVFRKLPEELQNDFQEYFSTIKSSTTQLYTLVEDFSRYTQMSKNDDLQTQLVDLNMIVENLELSLQNIIQEQNGRIINKGLPIVNSSMSLVYTIMKNIIENGLKFNKSAVPTVTLSAIEHDKHYQILIKDNGIGIKDAYQDQVFDMFKRLNVRDEYTGSGIGLAIVKLLADKIDVTVKLVSKVGEGSTFILEIKK